MLVLGECYGMECSGGVWLAVCAMQCTAGIYFPPHSAFPEVRLGSWILDRSFAPFCLHGPYSLAV